MKNANLLTAAMILVALTACTSDSAMLRNNAGQTVQCKNEGWGWLGAPMAAHNQSECIKKANAAGFKETGVPGAAVSPTVVQTAASTNPNGLNLAFPAGWSPQPISDAQKSNGTVILAYNKTTDSWAQVSTVSLEGITDRDAYVVSRRANQESRVKDATHTDVTLVDVNGRAARRFEVTGTAPDGQSVRFLYTIIFGQKDVVAVNAWTPAPNFSDQKATFQGLADRVSGIQ